MRSEEGKLFTRVSRRFRRKRFAHILSLIDHALKSRDEVSILDVGGRAAYWDMLPSEYDSKVKITVLNYDDPLSGAGASGRSGLRIEVVVGNGCDMSEYPDQSFDLVHSNSVIEHVGSYRNMVSFANEVRRVSRAYYVQTPNFWFPIDPHFGVPFVHWLPDTLRALLFMKCRMGGAMERDHSSALVRAENCRMVSRGMIKSLFPDGEQRSERFLFFMVKSLIVLCSAPVRQRSETELVRSHEP